MLTLFILFLSGLSMHGQLLPTVDAYKIFHKDSNPKIQYLGRLPGASFPLMIEKLNDWQNLSYLKYGIRRVIIVRELNGIFDTLAIRKYDKDGYLIEKDTFELMYLKQGEKWLYRTKYDYSMEDKLIRVLSRNIVFKPDTSYDWQKSLNLVYYYDPRNRLVKRKSWHYANDTVNMYFVSDNNDVVTGVNDQQFNYQLDEKGRLLEFSRSDRYGIFVTRLIYNDKKHSVSVYPSKSCHYTYYFKRRKQVFIQHFCPMVEDEKSGTLVPGKSNSSTIYTTALDSRLRIKSETITVWFDENLREKYEPSGRIVHNYRYNKKGLISVLATESTSGKWNQKIFFYYFTK